MQNIREIARSIREGRRRRRATLPWRELEAEAARQGCSPADIFFDRAGHGAADIQAGKQAGQQQPEPGKEGAQAEVSIGGGSGERDGGEAGSGSYRATQE
jgi:hypothetical protein